ncbi:hypothetical protein DUI87_22103 [Hirundo rustica rustica]|uniref:Uncharacterized protein n=1 Tax=Hirundo rustica rustica TaxID=333673 RepID=A0A3M0JKT5_HIRRU|nr:hypothetical protein DUI87_22103 [Hirundo rustica rustica]
MARAAAAAGRILGESRERGERSWELRKSKLGMIPLWEDREGITQLGERGKGKTPLKNPTDGAGTCSSLGFIREILWNVPGRTGQLFREKKRWEKPGIPETPNPLRWSKGKLSQPGSMAEGLQNPGMVWMGKDLKSHPIPTPSMGRDTSHDPRWIQIPISNLALDTSRDPGAATANLGIPEFPVPHHPPSREFPMPKIPAQSPLSQWEAIPCVPPNFSLRPVFIPFRSGGLTRNSTCRFPGRNPGNARQFGYQTEGKGAGNGGSFPVFIPDLGSAPVELGLWEEIPRFQGFSKSQSLNSRDTPRANPSILGIMDEKILQFQGFSKSRSLNSTDTPGANPSIPGILQAPVSQF